MTFNRIRWIREQNKLTQTELSKKLGVTRSSVNAWEQGISVPSAQHLVKLSKLFGVSTDYLLGQNTASDLSTIGLTEKDMEIVYSLIQHLRSLNQQIERE